MNLTTLLKKLGRLYQPAAIGTGIFFISTSIFANPVLDSVTHGQASVQQTATTTTVHQTSQKAIINWQSFNIGQTESTHFQQPAGGVALNRISPSQGPSSIYGRLTATGQIILVNPAGFYFGPNAYVNVGGLIASTANISDQDFLNGYYQFTNDPNYRGSITNQGRIIAADNGLVALIGGAVRNDGMIQARVGNVVLASGDAFTMSLAGNELVHFSIEEQATGRAMDYYGNEIEDGIQNYGSILAHGGQILVSAEAASGVLDHVINMEGVAETRAVYEKGGTIILSSDPDAGSIRVAGTLDASGKDENQSGGNIQVTGYNILIDENAKIDASGDAGGGKVNIGGNYLGQGPLPNANAVVMQNGAEINASAFSIGDGGEVIIWSDNYTNVSGEISATGGSESGDGGFIETSSKNVLTVGSLTVDTTASVGVTGEWLLDPYDITISSAATSGGTFNGSNPDIFTPNATANVQDSTINSNLGSSNVIITTGGATTGGDDGDITVDGTAAINWSSGNTLTLTAYRDIEFLTGSTITSTGGGALNLIANNAGQFDIASTFGKVINGGTLNIDGAVSIYYNPSNYTTPTSYTNTGAGTLTAYMYVNSATDLQNMNTNLAGFYALSDDISAGAFTPVGTSGTPFTGGFDGLNHAIDGLTINVGSGEAGLFGSINSNNTFANIHLTNVNISAGGTGSTGALAGLADGSFVVRNVSSSGTLSGHRIGGLVGAMAFNVAGGLITESYSTATIIGRNDTGGIVGANFSNGITKSYFSGAINNGSTFSTSGGIVGFLAGGNITDSYNLGSVTSASFAGGIVGFATDASSIMNNTYSTGAISGGTEGGIAASINNNASVTNSFWDADTSGQINAVGAINSGAFVNFTFGGCFTGTCSSAITSTYLFGGTTPANLSSLANYTTTLSGAGGTAWSAIATPSVSAPTETWFLFEGQTRPLLMMENTTYIQNTHQLQMAGATIGANYTLAGNLDLESAFINRADVWGTDKNSMIGNGFVPIGNSINPFSGEFDGGGYAIDNLYLNYTTDNIGLFGTTSTTALITNLGVINQDVTGNSHVGGIVGYNRGNISNSYTTGQITATTTGSARLGGIAGYSLGTTALDLATISTSYSSATVSTTATGTVQGSYVGGLVGWLDSYSVIDQSYFTGFVDARQGEGGALGVGGLVGALVGGTITNSYSTGNVSGYNLVGGIAGFGQLTSSAFSTNANINNTYSTSYLVTNSGGSLQGGLVGFLDAGSTLSNSFWDTSTSNQTVALDASSSGTVTNVIGGCLSGTCVNGGTENMSQAATFSSAPYNWDFATVWNIVEDYSYPYLRAFYSTTPRVISGNTSVNPNSAVNLVVNGAIAETARTTAQNTTSQFYFLQGFNLISGIDNSIADASPILLYLDNASQRANVIALTPNTTGSLSNTTSLDLTTNNTIIIGNNGSTSGGLSNSLLTSALGALNNTDTDILYTFSGDDITINSGNNFTSNANTNYTLNGNLLANSSNITFEGAVDVTGTPNITTTTSGNISINNTINSPAAELIINSAGEVTLNTTDLDTLSVTAGSNINIDANITTTNDQTYTGPMIIGTAGTTSLVSNAGDITALNAVTGNGSNTLLISNAGAGSLISGVINDLALVKNGAGTLIIANNNLYTGGTTINGGTLQVGNGGVTGAITGSIVNSGSLVFNTSNNFTIAGIISGTGSVTQNGTGTVELDAANTYTGGTTLNSGTLIAADASAFGTSGAITINDGATLQTSINTGLTNNSLITVNGTGVSGNGAIYISTSGGDLNNPITLGSSSYLRCTTDCTLNGAINTNGSDLQLLSASSNNIFSNISGSGSVTYNGGLWYLQGTNSYSGGTFINNGTAAPVNSANKFGTGAITLGSTSGGSASANILFYFIGSNSTLANAIILGNTTGGLSLSPYGLTAALNFTGGITGTNNIALSNGAFNGGTAAVNFTTGSINNTGSFNNAISTAIPVTISAAIGPNVTNLIQSSGASVMTLTGTNTYDATTISAGSLVIGDGGASGSVGTGTISNNGNLTINRSATTTIAGAVTGTGSLTQLGSGITILENDNTYSGGTTISAGTLQIGNGGATGAVTGNIINNDALVFNTSNSFTIAGLISGTGSLTQTGSGVVTLTGANTYTGDTTISSGTLSVNSIGDAGTDTALGNSSSAINIGSTGALQYIGSGHSSARPIILTGSGGTLDASGSGDLTLSGGVTGDTFGLVLTGNGTGILSGVVGTTTGSLTKNGSGTWTLANTANTYSGQTIINNGTVIATALANGGSNSSLGATVASTPIIIGSATPATLVFSGTNASNTTNRLITIGAGGGTIQTTSPTAMSLNFTGTITTNGSLTFDLAALNTVRTNNFGIGVYGITGTGSVIKNGDGFLQYGSGGSLFSGQTNYSGSTTVNGGTLRVTHTESLSNSSSIVVNSGASLDYFLSGTLVNTNPFQISGDGFNGAGALTVSFSTPTITNPITLMADASIGGSGAFTHAAAITENVAGLSLTKVGSGNLIKSGSSSFTGSLDIDAGRIYALSANSLGSGASQPSAINVADGATFNFNAAINNTSPIRITGNGIDGNGAIQSNAPSQISVNNQIVLMADAGIGGRMTIETPIAENSAGLNLSKVQTTSLPLIFNASNTYTGETRIQQGYVSVQNVNGLGATSGVIVANGASLDFDFGTATLTNTAPITLNGTGYIAGSLRYNGGAGVTTTLNNNIILGSNATIGFGSGSGAANLQLNGVISDGGNGYALTKNGIAGIIFTGNNTYSGGTNINNGFLRVGSGGTSGTLGTGNIANSASLTFNRSDALTVSGVISGTGSVTQSGTGTTILTGNNTYTGNTTIGDGTLQIGNGGATGEIVGAITNNSALVFNTSNSFTNSNVISGTGSVTQNGSGTVTFSGANSYSGGTTINNGILIAANNAALGTSNVTVNDGSTLRLSSATITNALTLNGSGDAAANGALDVTSGISFANGTILLGSNTTAGAGPLTLLNLNNSTINAGGFNLTLSGAGLINMTSSLSNGSLTKNGTGTATISGNNTYSGATSINDGTIIASNNNALGMSAVTVADGATLQIGNTIDVGNTITINGAGFTGRNGALETNFNGTGTVSGTIILGSSASIGNYAGTTLEITNTGTISGSSFDLTVNGPGDTNIASILGIGTGELIKNGSGTLTLTSDNTYTGGTTISDGTLQVGNGGITGSITGSVDNEGSLIFNTSTAVSTLNNFITGSGTIEKQNGGLLIIGGTNTYDGQLIITGGFVRADSDSALGSNLAETVIQGSGTLLLNGVDIGNEAIILNGGTLINSGTSNASGNITLGADSVIDVQSGTLNYTGNIDDATNSFNVTKTGAGELRLPGSHNHDGGFTLDAGTLLIGDNDSLGNGTFTFNGGALGVTTNGLVITRDIVLNADIGLSGSNNFTLSGDISGATQSVTKTGTSIVSLAGNNTFGGDLNINEGLVIADSNTALGAGSTIIADGTTLQIADGRTTSGDIILNGSGLTGQNGALVGAGSANHSGNITLNADSSIGTSAASDVLTLGGNINGAMALSFAGPGTVSVTGNIGNTTAPTSVTANADLMVDGSITSDGHQTYNNPVALMGTSTFTISGTGTQNIIFNNNITGGQDLNLTGTGAGTYNFAFNSGITQNNITVDGGGASTNNALTVANGSDQTFMLTGANSGNINGNTGVTGNFNFSNINNLTGGSGADNFTLNGGSISGSVNGAGGTNTLQAANVANTWNITNNNGGSVTGIGGLFSNMQNLMGGTGLDIFNFTEGFNVAGIIDGGDLVNLNNIRFNNYATRLDLHLSLPISNVFNAGNVYSAGNSLIAGFTRVQQSDGNSLGYITLPDKPNITVTYYDSTLLNGEIGDPFYFYGWTVGNPPSTVPNVDNNEIASINEQPIVNAAQVQAGIGGTTVNTSILNTTKITPINDNNSVQTGAACYTAGQ